MTCQNRYLPKKTLDIEKLVKQTEGKKLTTSRYCVQFCASNIGNTLMTEVVAMDVVWVGALIIWGEAL